MPPSDALRRLREAGASDALAAMLIVPGARQSVPDPTPSQFELWALRVRDGKDPEIGGKR